MDARPVAGAVAGLTLWSATEYAVHRWVMHRPGGGGDPVSAEHLDHHANPDRTTELRLDRNLLWKAAAFAVVAVPGTALAGRRAGLAAAVAFTAGYAAYTDLHHRIHHRPPRNRLSRAVWRHHLAHHFGSPRRGYGVTSSVWDAVAGTRNRVDAPLRIPGRLAPEWLVDELGRVRPEHALDYEVVSGRAAPAGA